MSERQIKLFRYLSLPGERRGEDGQWTAKQRYGPKVYHEVAQEAEAALFDGVFRADGAAPDPETIRLYANHTGFSHDAFQHLASVAAVTSHIGLVGTASSTFNLPYAFARQLQTLDHLSGGRVGWNAVTSFHGERAFGLKELPPQEDRYARAAEFVEIVHGVWGSWKPGAVNTDPTSDHGVVNADFIETLDFHGKYFDVEAASTLPRSPQGWPVQFQAGASGPAKPYAARFAEAIYSASTSIDHARAFYAEIKSLVADHGRDPAHTLILPGFHPFIAKTRAEAEEKYNAQYEAVNLEAGLKEVERQFGNVDYSGLDLDKPVPEELLPNTDTLRRRQSRPGLYVDIARQPGITLRKLIQRVGADGGHYSTFGSYDDIAAELELWFTTGAADGFALGIRGDDDGNSFGEFAAEVIPRLQDKGLFRRKYEGSTLRENLGLPIPEGALRYL